MGLVVDMTENKRFTYLDYSRDGHIGSFYLNDKPITNKEVCDLLKEQHETIQFKEKHIFCLQSVIQTIDVELQEKGMTKERFEEIKDYWYQKVMYE